MRKVSTEFYAGSWIIGGLLTIVLFVLSYTTESRSDAGMYRALAMIPILYTAIVMFVLLYKAWASIQDQYTRITPGKAIGFLFIPLFNYYWAFQAYWGLAKEHNLYLKRHNLNLPELNEGFYLAYSIVLICNIIISFILPILTVIIGISFCIKISFDLCKAINNLAEVYPLASFGSASGDIPLGGPVSIGVNYAAGSIDAYNRNNKPSQSICPNCSTAVSPGSRFCPGCGDPQMTSTLPATSAQVICPNPICRHNNEAGSSYCEKCGSLLQP